MPALGANRSSLAVLGPLITVLVIAVVVLLSVRPGVVFGTGGGGLANSFAGKLGDPYGRAECQQKGNETWRCRYELDPGSGFGAEAELTTTGSGCWKVSRAYSSIELEPADARQIGDLHGCVNLLDVIGL